jgi:hypothetical protein
MKIIEQKFVLNNNTLNSFLTTKEARLFVVKYQVKSSSSTLYRRYIPGAIKHSFNNNLIMLSSKEEDVRLRPNAKSILDVDEQNATLRWSENNVDFEVEFVAMENTGNKRFLIIDLLF